MVGTPFYGFSRLLVCHFSPCGWGLGLCWFALMFLLSHVSWNRSSCSSSKGRCSHCSCAERHCRCSHCHQRNQRLDRQPKEFIQLEAGFTYSYPDFWASSVKTVTNSLYPATVLSLSFAKCVMMCDISDSV